MCFTYLPVGEGVMHGKTVFTGFAKAVCCAFGPGFFCARCRLPAIDLGGDGNAVGKDVAHGETGSGSADGWGSPFGSA